MFSVVRPYDVGNDFRIWKINESISTKAGFIKGDNETWGLSQTFQISLWDPNEYQPDQPDNENIEQLS